MFVATFVAALPVAHYSWHKRVRSVERRILQATDPDFAGYSDSASAKIDDRFDLRRATCGLPRLLCRACLGDNHHVIMLDASPSLDTLMKLGELPYLQGLIVRGDVQPIKRGLPRLRKLRYLCLHGTGATDVTVANIRSMGHLRQLRLGHTRVSDACIDDLSNLQQLEKLSVHATNITDVGLARLRRLLPNCRID